MIQFTIRRLLVVAAVVAVALMASVTTITEAKSSLMVVGVFGPALERNGFRYDRQKAHAQLIAGLDCRKYVPIDEPAWAVNCEISGQPRSAWSPKRSDWFVVRKADAKNYVHFASAEDGLAIDVWIYEGLIMHQQNDPNRVLAAEKKLSKELERELYRKWVDWCFRAKDQHTSP